MRSAGSAGRPAIPSRSLEGFLGVLVDRLQRLVIREHAAAQGGEGRVITAEVRLYPHNGAPAVGHDHRQAGGFDATQDLSTCALKNAFVTSVAPMVIMVRLHGHVRHADAC